jgi:hypothetical protein
MTPRKPQDFRWDAENERLYFSFENDENTYYLDAKNMKIVTFS